MRPVSLAVLLVQVLAVMASAQDAQEAKEPKRLPAKVMQSWERFEKQVQKNRELYDKANEKALAGFQRELERMNPPVEVDDLVRRFQQEAIVQLDVDARPPPPPPPDKNIAVFNGHRYKLVEEHLSWDEAKKRCEEMGGHLLVIDDRFEQEFIQKSLGEYRDRNPQLPEGVDIWMGVSRDKNKKWMTVTGKEQVYSKWYVLEPRDWFSYVRYSIGHNAWVTGEPTRKEKTFFICEWDQ